MSRLNALITSGVIATFGCTSSAQVKVEQKPVAQVVTPAKYPDESMCHYLERLGIRDPAICNKEEERRKIFEELDNIAATTVADIFLAQNMRYIDNCMYTQQYDSKTEEEKKSICANKVQDIIDQNQSFQRIDPNMQELIRIALRKNIMER